MSLSVKSGDGFLAKVLVSVPRVWMNSGAREEGSFGASITALKLARMHTIRLTSFQANYVVSSSPYSSKKLPRNSYSCRATRSSFPFLCDNRIVKWTLYCFVQNDIKISLHVKQGKRIRIYILKQSETKFRTFIVNKLRFIKNSGNLVYKWMQIIKHIYIIN